MRPIDPPEWPSLIDHPEWPLLRPAVSVASTGDKWKRLEVKRPDDMGLLHTFLTLITPCVACGDFHCPVRPRHAPTNLGDLREHPVGGLFLASCCQLPRCTRTKLARNEKRLIRTAVEAWIEWGCT